MKYFLLICRILVGATFIVSGLVKANDPVGFGIKLEEYFEPSALNMPWAIPYALPLAMLACLGEVVLGFAVLVGGRMRLATTAILVLTLFFGWLTGYTWNCNARQQAGEKMTYTVVENGKEVEHDKTCVTDCGCFGDAMKGSLGRSLTPKESFFKDMILLVLLLPVFFVSWIRKPGIAFNDATADKVIIPGAVLVTGLWSWVFGWTFFLWFLLVALAGYLIIKKLLSGSVRAEWITAIWVALLSFGFTYNTWQHLPWKDYRPYAVGKSISEQRKNAKPPVENIFVIYKNKVSGEQKEFDSKGKYPWDDSTWVYVDRRVETVDPGVPSLVQDFSLTDKDGTNITEDVLNETTPVLLIVVRKVGEAQTKCVPAINALVDAAYKAGWYPYGVSSSSYDEVEDFRHTNQCGFDFLTCDETTLKTMIRSNPGVVLLQQGTIRGQWHCNDVPTIEEAKAMLK